MPPSNDYADLCIKDIMERIQALDLFQDKLFYVYDQEVFLESSEELQYPCAGVIWEGIYSKNKPGDMGKSSFVSVAVVLLAGERTLDATQKEDKTAITLILDKVRKAILGQRSPTGHKWEFALESPHDLIKGSGMDKNERPNGLGYYQRWTASVIM